MSMKNRLILENIVYGLDDPGFISRQGQEIFLFYKMCRPAMGPT
jgi:hypothetical protein